MSSPRDTQTSVASDYQGLRSSPVSPPLPCDHINKYSPPYIQSANRATVDINRNSLGGSGGASSSGVMSQDGVRANNNSSPSNTQSGSPLHRTISPTNVDYRYNISTNTFRKHLPGGATQYGSPSPMTLPWVSRPGEIPTYINERAALLNSLNMAAAEGTSAAVRELMSSSHPLPSSSRMMSPPDITGNKHPPPSWGLKENLGVVEGASMGSAVPVGFVGSSSSPDNDALKMARFCMLQQPLNLPSIQNLPSYYLCNHDNTAAAAAAAAAVAAAGGPLHISPSGSLSRSPHNDYMNQQGGMHTGGFIPPAPVSYSYGKMGSDTSPLSPTLSQGRSSGFIPPLPLVNQGSNIVTGSRARSASASQVTPHPGQNLLQVRTDLGGGGGEGQRLSSSYPTAVAQLSRPPSLDSSHGLLMVTTRSESPSVQSINDTQKSIRVTPSPDLLTDPRPLSAAKRNSADNKYAEFDPCDDEIGETAESERNDDSPDPSKDCKIAENIPSNLLSQIHRKMEKPSKCPYCILAYSCSSSLNRHIKMKHPEHYHGVERKKSKRQSVNGAENGEGSKSSSSDSVAQKPNEAAQSMLQSLGLSTPLAEVVDTPPSGPQFDPLIIQTSFFPIQGETTDSSFNQDTTTTAKNSSQKPTSGGEGESGGHVTNGASTTDDSNSTSGKTMPASLNSTLEDSLRAAMKPIAASSSLSADNESVAGQNSKEVKHPNGTIPCRLCGTSYNNRRKYRRHIQSKAHQLLLKENNNYLKSRKRKLKEKHRQERSKWLTLLNPVNNPRCDLCNREFTCDATYQVHIESKEHVAIEDARRAAKIQEQRPKYTCELCNLVFNNRSERAQHYRSEGHRKLKQAQEFAIRAVKLLPLQPPNPGVIERPASVSSTNSTVSGVDANSDADSDASTKCGNSSDTLTAGSDDDDISSQDTGLSLPFSGTSSSGLSTPCSLKRSSESDEESELKKLKQSLFQDGHEYLPRRVNGFHHHHEKGGRTEVDIGGADVPLVILPGRNIPAKVALNVVEELVDYFQQLKGDEVPGIFAGL